MNRVVTYENWKQIGKPKIIFNHEDVTKRCQVAREGSPVVGFVVLLKRTDPMDASVKFPRYEMEPLSDFDRAIICEENQDINSVAKWRPVFEFLRGDVVFEFPKGDIELTECGIY